MDGASRKFCLVQAGGVLIEIVQYLDPVGKAWPDDYRISDQGLLNIAVGFRNRDAFLETMQNCADANVHPNHPPADIGDLTVAYVNDHQGFSVELLYLAPNMDEPFGFLPLPVPDSAKPNKA